MEHGSYHTHFSVISSFIKSLRYGMNKCFGLCPLLVTVQNRATQWCNSCWMHFWWTTSYSTPIQFPVPLVGSSQVSCLRDHLVHEWLSLRTFRATNYPLPSLVWSHQLVSPLSPLPFYDNRAEKSGKTSVKPFRTAWSSSLAARLVLDQQDECRLKRVTRTIRSVRSLVSLCFRQWGRRSRRSIRGHSPPYCPLIAAESVYVLFFARDRDICEQCVESFSRSQTANDRTRR